MKSIGFIDYYISEWHANNYPQWIKNANEKLGTDYEVKFAWAERDISPVDGVSTDEWCEKMGVARCNSIAELCEKSDTIIILAPSDPDKHLQYAKKALAYGKRTYIDKTFAPDFETAKKIFEIAKEYNTPFFSTSALRYAEELKVLNDADNIILTGGGSNFNEYIIHTVEMAVVLLKSPAKQVKVETLGEQRICSIVAENGAKAVIVYSPVLGFTVTAQNSNGKYINKAITSDFFAVLISSILEFFESGVLPFGGDETLEAMRLRTKLLEGEKAGGEWLSVVGDVL